MLISEVAEEEKIRRRKNICKFSISSIFELTLIKMKIHDDCYTYIIWSYFLWKYSKKSDESFKKMMRISQIYDLNRNYSFHLGK